jgi:hypothetical protein
MVTKKAAASIGPGLFKKYEHILYVMAQLSRIAYCDTGIAHKVIQASLGMSNDVVNKVITAYDWKYGEKVKQLVGRLTLSEKRSPIKSQPGKGGRPMESYALGPAGSGEKYGTYISSPEDMTCYIVKGSSVRANPNSIILPTDVIITFKGSSTMANFKHDLMSQFTSADLEALLQPTGIKLEGQSNNVTGAFVKPLVNSWNVMINTISQYVTDGCRLFLTGHSLGGAYASLFAFILAEAKATLPSMNKIKSFHLITFGAPCILGDNARNTFNRHLDSGLITLDRVVSQRVASRSAATQVLLGGVVGPNDVIPTIPVGFSHPGYRPLNNPVKNFYPEAKGRPYSIDNVRKFYGVQTKTRYRDPTTWPFEQGYDLGDRARSALLNDIVMNITKLAEIPDTKDVVPPVALKNAKVEGDPQAGGAWSEAKAIYEKTTLERIPNFVSVQGSVYAFGFAHAEYLGMFFLGGFRQAGMKNPGFGNNVAVFDMYPNGVTINYVDFKPVTQVNVSPEPSEGNPEANPVANPVAIASLSKGPVNAGEENPSVANATRENSPDNPANPIAPAIAPATAPATAPAAPKTLFSSLFGTKKSSVAPMPSSAYTTTAATTTTPKKRGWFSGGARRTRKKSKVKKHRKSRRV